MQFPSEKNNFAGLKIIRNFAVGIKTKKAMKKNVYIVLLCMAFAMPAAAQSPMSYNDGCYLYNQLDSSNSVAVMEDPMLDSNWHAFLQSLQPISRGYEYILTAPTIIYGIAVTSTAPLNGVACLYRRVNNKAILVDSIVMHSEIREFMYSAYDTEGKRVDDVVPCYEYMFPEPYVLSDTIYVGFRAPYHQPTSGFIRVLFDISYSQRWIDISCTPPNISDTGGWGLTQYWGGYFPIIKNGCDSCITVQDMRFTKVGNSAAIAQWDTYADHNDWLLCYGPQGFTPDTGQAVGTVAPRRALTGLSPTDHYDVYVKAHCSCCGREEWTPWAGPFDLCLSEIGIDEVQAPEVTLAPNPTTGMLTVGCEAAIEEVELYDLQGRCALSRTCSGSTAVLDLTALPAGSYVLVAHTAKGMATRMVEKR